MDDRLSRRRRALLLTYRRYLEADRAWTIARRETKAWFPASSQPVPSTIGNPGSRIRRLFEQRERALLQLETARLKMEAAKKRFAARRRANNASGVVLIAYAGRGLD